MSSLARVWICDTSCNSNNMFCKLYLAVYDIQAVTTNPSDETCIVCVQKCWKHIIRNRSYKIVFNHHLGISGCENIEYDGVAKECNWKQLCIILQAYGKIGA